MEKKQTERNTKNTTCPYCGFDFKTLKPSARLQVCPCGKCYADISKDLIRILHDGEKGTGETTFFSII